MSLTPHTNTTPPAPLATSTLIPHVQKPEKGEERRKEGKRRREEEEEGEEGDGAHPLLEVAIDRCSPMPPPRRRWRRRSSQASSSTSSHGGAPRSISFTKRPQVELL
jgi:hypothetical protein